MNCLIELCFVASIYVTGGIGYQGLEYDYNSELASNGYGYILGEVSLVVEMKNGMYVEAKHLSGVNTVEDDYGLNAIMIGAKIYFKGN